MNARPAAAWRSLVRNAFVAAVSAAVVAFLVFYALSRPEVKLQTSVGSLESHPGGSAIVHGRVLEADGDGVSGARLTVGRPGAPQRTARTGERGFFRLDVKGGCGTYEIELAARASGRSLARHLLQPLCPGQALELVGRIVATGNFVWVPTR